MVCLLVLAAPLKSILTGVDQVNDSKVCKKHGDFCSLVHSVCKILCHV